MPLGDFLVAYLQKIGVTHLFGIPGDLVLRLFSRLGKPRALKIVTLSHEPGVGFAADGYARATGRIGVVCVTYGAGGHNMVNPVAGSFSERVPVLVISGGPGEEERKLGTLIHHQAKEIESQLRIYRELTCAARVIDDAATAAESVHEVVRTVWREQRPGYLEIHRDMVERPIPVPRGIIAWDGALVFGRSDERRVDEAVRETAERFNAARRPLTMVGIETFRYKLQKDIRALAERMGAPVTTTVLGKGAFPMDHPLFMGVHIGPLSPPPIVKRVDRADLVLNLGTLLTDMNLGSRPPSITRDRSIWAVGGRVNVRVISLHANVGFLVRQLQNHPGEFAISHQQIRTPTEKFVGYASAAKQHDQVRQRAMAANQQQIRDAADAERSAFRERGSADALDAEFGQGSQNARVVKLHGDSA